MSARIAFVHTVGFLAESFRERMKTELPALDHFHVLNESLLQDLLRGRDTATVYRRVVAQILLAADTGVDQVVVTCSSTSPAVDLARRLTPCPVLKIDDPMAAAAVQAGRRIGLLCTAASTVAPSSALLQSHAQEAGVEIELIARLEADAYQAILSGDRALHDARVTSAATQLAEEVDVIVLAQASLAHLQPLLAQSLRVPVLASPELLIRTLRQRWNQVERDCAAAPWTALAGATAPGDPGSPGKPLLRRAP